MRARRFSVGVGVVLLGAVCFGYSCQSTPGAGPGTGTAGTSGDAGMPGGTGTAGTTGTGGVLGTCTGAGGFAGTYSEVAMTPCGPMTTCDGAMQVTYRYCDQRACSGDYMVSSKVACPTSTTCGGGKCLTHVGPPAKSCSVATDCGLPTTVCVADTEQLIFSDPSCDDGQCHWKEIVDTCGTTSIGTVVCRGGACYAPVVSTGGPLPPTPVPDQMQPPAAPDQSCGATAECTQPPPACFHDSVVSYVHGVCVAGACSWDVNLDECAGTCGNGACVTP